jgi:hypothetical protein
MNDSYVERSVSIFSQVIHIYTDLNLDLLYSIVPSKELHSPALDCCTAHGAGGCPRARCLRGWDAGQTMSIRVLVKRYTAIPAAFLAFALLLSKSYSIANHVLNDNSAPPPLMHMA